MIGLLNTSAVCAVCCNVINTQNHVTAHSCFFLKLKFWNLNMLSKTGINCMAEMPLPFAWSILYDHRVLSRFFWFPELIWWKNCIHLILSQMLLPFAMKPVIAYFLSVYVLILSSSLLLPWPDLLWCLSWVLMRLSRKAGGVTGGHDDNYPSTPFHLTTVQASATDLISDVRRCNRTQQKGRSIGVIIDRLEWGFAERSAPIDSHIIALQPLCCCVLVINYEAPQDARTPARF